MAGGGSRKDESVVLNSTNVYAALGTLRKKKKSSPSSSSTSTSEKERHDSSKVQSRKEKEPNKEVFWAPAPLTVKSWADVDDEDDDDYYATTAPPESVWPGPGDSKPEKEAVEESESEEECLDEADDAIEEEYENEHKPEPEPEPVALTEVEQVVKNPPQAFSAHKDTERQLSKKELKKKGLEELDAVLAELGYTKQETTVQDDSYDVAPQKKVENNGEEEKKENAPGESKSAKKKKKKEKSLKDAEESQVQPLTENIGNGHGTAETEKMEDASSVGVKERLKKVVFTKKKKSSKEMDAAARAAASEAAARRAKLAAAKKKEKNHYNQQPVRQAG